MDVSFIIRLIDQFTAPAKKVRESASGIGQALKAGGEGFAGAIKEGFSVGNIEAATKNAQDKLNQARGRLLGAFGQAMTLAAPIRSAIEWENAMLGVSKQLDGARDASGNLTPAYYEMSDEIQKLGRITPVANAALAEMVTAALRMGVAKDEVIDFVQETAKMATAFELPEGPLADSMGKIAGLYKIPMTAIGELGDSINYLDDNAISTGGDIIDYLTRVGGSAGAVKISAKDMAALGSTLLTLGDRTETAGTATNAIMTKLASATKGTKKFRGAMKELGLSTKEVQDGMQKDAFGTILTVLDAVNKIPSSERMGILADLVGLEHADTLAKLVSQVDELRRQRDLANGEAAKGSMDREYQARLKTTTAQWAMLRNRISEVSVTIGSVLLPALNGIMATIGPLVSSMAEWADANPELTKYLVATIAALMSLSIAAKVLGFVFAGMRVGIIPLLGFFLKFNSAGRNIAVGWRLLSGSGKALGLVFRGLAGGGNLLSAGLSRLGRVGRLLNFAWRITAIFEAVSKLTEAARKASSIKEFFGNLSEFSAFDWLTVAAGVAALAGPMASLATASLNLGRGIGLVKSGGGIAALIPPVAAGAATMAGLEAVDPKGNLGGMTKSVDDWLRNKLGLEAKDTGITPAEIWQGLTGGNGTKETPQPQPQPPAPPTTKVPAAPLPNQPPPAAPVPFSLKAIWDALMAPANTAGVAGAKGPVDMSLVGTPSINVASAVQTVPTGTQDVRITNPQPAPVVTVTVHATTNASPEAIGAEVGRAAGAAIGKVGGQLMSAKSGALHGGTE